MIYDHGAAHVYHSYWTKDSSGSKTRNPKFNEQSAIILDIKNCGETASRAVEEFIHSLLSKITEESDASIEIVAAIPGHQAHSISQGLVDLTHAIADQLYIVAMPTLLTRTKTIEKLSQGGNRSVLVHQDSMTVVGQHNVIGKSILLIDDVRTTGNSLTAGANLLLQAGAKAVHILAIGQTRDENN